MKKIALILLLAGFGGVTFQAKAIIQKDINQFVAAAIGTVTVVRAGYQLEFDLLAQNASSEIFKEKVAERIREENGSWASYQNSLKVSLESLEKTQSMLVALIERKESMFVLHTVKDALDVLIADFTKIQNKLDQT